MRAPISDTAAIVRRLSIPAALLTSLGVAACDSAAPTGNDLPQPGSGQPAPVTVARVDISGASWLVEQGWGSYTATVTGSNGAAMPDRIPTWSVSDTAIAMVQNGSVYAKRAGDVTLVAAAGGKADTLHVVVRPLTVDSIAVYQVGAPVRVGETGWVGVHLRAADGRTLHDRVVTWASSDPSIATVESGKVRGIREGIVDIVATSEGRSATQRIAVQASRAAGTWTVRVTELRNANTLCTVTGLRITLTQVGDSLDGEIPAGSASVICTAIVGQEGPYTTPMPPIGRATGTIADNGYIMLTIGGRWSIQGVLDRSAQKLDGTAYYVEGDEDDMIRPIRVGHATFAR